MMPINWSPASRTLLLVGLLAVGDPTAMAQTGRAWVDPPVDLSAPPPGVKPPEQAPALGEPGPQSRTAAPAAPSRSAQPLKVPPLPAPPPSRQAVQPPQTRAPAIAAKPREEPAENSHDARLARAKALAVSYLNSWSGPNDAALGATPDFYAPRILFHGRTVSLKQLESEKRRFAQRWPDRDYRPRQDTMGTACNPKGDICTVHAVFDFRTANPAQNRISQGTGALQLIVHFIGDKPVIVAEHSMLLNRNHKGKVALEGASNE